MAGGLVWIAEWKKPEDYVVCQEFKNSQCSTSGSEKEGSFKL
jgi:hypothetical protein